MASSRFFDQQIDIDTRHIQFSGSTPLSRKTGGHTYKSKQPTYAKLGGCLVIVKCRQPAHQKAFSSITRLPWHQLLSALKREKHFFLGQMTIPP